MSFTRPLFATSRPRWIVFFVVMFALISLTGCVRRRMTIRSNPVGALVYVDDYEIGTTPISHDFTYYGTRKVQLVKDGYETLTVMQPMRPPWWQIPPIDFVTENILPGELTDSRTLSYQMVPQRIIPPDELRARAENLRSQMQPACYLQPIAPQTPAQPILQPMQPGEMVPINPGMINTPHIPTHPQPGEWVSPGSVNQPNMMPQPNVQPQPFRNGQPVQPNYGQPVQPNYGQPTQPNYGQPTQPYAYPQPGAGMSTNLPIAFPPSQPITQ